MKDAIEKAAETLDDTRAGWVTRRDAADFLGKTALRAVKALHKHLEEPDVDVQRAVLDQMGRIRGGVEGIRPTAEQQQYTLDALAKACAKEGSRLVSVWEKGYQVEVRLKNDRRQVVYISPHKRRDGAELIRVFSYCGAPTEETLKWALQANMKLSHGALALTSEGGAERLVLARTFIAEYATPAQVKAAVKEMAFYGDWMEQKLTGLDEL